MPRILFPLVSLSDLSQDGHHEGFDTGLVDAAGDAEVAVLTPFRTPAVGYDLLKNLVFFS